MCAMVTLTCNIIEGVVSNGLIGIPFLIGNSLSLVFGWNLGDF